tara:strand:- start:774 stop:1055 length:282 start_codon:yes stop_codon:yes gene_type:complete
MTTSLETFQIALDEIKKLTEEKQELLNIIRKQEKAIKLLNERTASANIPKVEAKSSTGLYRLESMIKESNAAMKRYTEKLRKEGEEHAKQKQS